MFWNVFCHSFRTRPWSELTTENRFTVAITTVWSGLGYLFSGRGEDSDQRGGTSNERLALTEITTVEEAELLVLKTELDCQLFSFSRMDQHSM